MPEPMSGSPESNPSKEQLSQQKQESLDELRRQNTALGGKAMTFMKKDDGSDFVIFSNRGEGEGVRGGFADGPILIQDRLAIALVSKNELTVEEAINQTGESHDGMDDILAIEDDVAFGRWWKSLKVSERQAAELLKKERADSYYTPKALGVIHGMPSHLSTVSGVDLAESEA